MPAREDGDQEIVAPWPQDPLNRTIAALDKQGFHVFVHNVGSTQSYAAVLDAVYSRIKRLVGWS